MTDPVDPKGIAPSQFSGHHGYVVADNPDEGEQGVLDPKDVVRRLSKDGGTRGLVDEGDQLSETLSWDDAGFAAARTDFLVQSSQVGSVRATLKALSEQLTAFTAGTEGVTKPSEGAMNALQQQATTLSDSESLAPSLRGDAFLVIAGIRGLVASAHRRNKLSKAGPARDAYANMKLAIRVGRDNCDTWSTFGLTLVGATLATGKSKAARFLAKLIGVNIARDSRAVCQGLARFIDIPEGAIVLVALLEARGDEALSGSERALLETTRERIVLLRQSDPAAIEEAEALVKKVRDAIESGT